MLKRIALLLAALLLFSSAAYAESSTAQTQSDIVYAAALPNWDTLERYASFEQNGTVWSVRSNQGQAALNRMGWGLAPYDGYACFGLELTGDSETGVTVPMIVFYYDGTLDLNGRAASVAVDGTRYDFVLCREELPLEKVTLERLTAPLDECGLEMIRSMLTAQRVQVWLQGDTTFKMDINPQDTSFASAREELAVRSMNALSDMLREFDAITPYTLWDINKVWWNRLRGAESTMRKITLSEDQKIDVCGVTLKAPMYMLSRGAINEDVRKLQKLLIAGGFMQGGADGAYGEGTVYAVEAAQTWFSLPVTGSADETLIRLLSGENTAFFDAALSAPLPRIHTAPGVCELSMKRYWFADALESSGGDRRSVLDRDDTLLIYEGIVKNLSTGNLDFYWQMSAVVRCGGYEYPCILLCERNEGMSLTSSLPPQGQARLLIYAEIPENIAVQGDWTLEISAEGHKFLFE